MEHGIPELALTELTSGGENLPLLVVGPSLGTSVSAMWSVAAVRLGTMFTVVGWDLPGHDASPPAERFTLADIAAGLLSALDRRSAGVRFHYAGDSLSGAVGLQLLLDAPGRLQSATLCCTGARIGEPEGWYERAQTVRSGGTAVLLDSAADRWFGPGFPERDPQTAQALLDDLAATDTASYAAACDALATFDVRGRLAEIATPVLAVAGDHDSVLTPTVLGYIATGVQSGMLVVLDGVAHLAPAEAPDRVADLIMQHAGDPPESNDRSTDRKN
jgi:3-oxoadipate enol-lactonase / 4-carboxymuconolactone decarboxylase